MATDMWRDGERITAEKLNQMAEMAQEARDGIVKAQIKELKLLCDEAGKMWGAELCSPEGIKTTVPSTSTDSHDMIKNRRGMP